ncbi:MAG: SH3 domain-containing protein [Elusimicrobia bacterium]|nr:SH3 domain-containing protein [Elusimicrobiota bacterium]
MTVDKFIEAKREAKQVYKLIGILLINLSTYHLINPIPLRGASLQQANQQYQAGNFGMAATLYEELLSKNPENPYLQYNSGNAYFKNGKLGKAVVHYEKATLLLPRDSDIQSNLELALKKVGEDLIPAGIPRVLYAGYHLLSLQELTALSLAGYWISLIFLSIYLFWQNPGKKRRLKPFLITLVLAEALFLSWWGLRRNTSISNLGVVLESNAEIRSGPGTNFTVAFNVPEGRRVQVIQEKGDWLEVGVLKEGIKGWVSTKAVEKI